MKNENENENEKKTYKQVREVNKASSVGTVPDNWLYPRNLVSYEEI